jgi:hypothetical protein
MRGVDADSGHSNKASRPDHAPPARSEFILVVDNDQRVRPTPGDRLGEGVQDVGDCPPSVERMKPMRRVDNRWPTGSSPSTESESRDEPCDWRVDVNEVDT